MAVVKEVRVWTDGCFDMAHFGHANALRQAKQLGDKLVVGVHGDEDILHHKGPPVFTAEERYRMVRAIRWVDEVVENAPYETILETLDKHNCDFCVHGDDIVLSADGVDTYKAVKDAGRFREVARTTGISTTDLVGRLLLATKSNSTAEESAVEATANVNIRSPYTGMSSYCTSGIIAQFYENRRKPQPSDVVVYVAGAFDLFHVGHLAFLEAAAAQGTYLIVGVHGNATVTSYKGPNRPLLSLHERVLCTLAYRCVDDVVIAAPYAVTSELLDSFHVSIVFHGSRTPLPDQSMLSKTGDEVIDPYEEPKKRGIFRFIDSGCDMTTDSLIDRIIANREKFRERNRKKEAKEVNYIQKSASKH